MTKRYSLTDEHRAQLKPWADQWVANAISTKPMDDDERELCRDAVRRLYEAGGLKPPARVVFVPSPFVLRFAGGFSAGIWHQRATGQPTSNGPYAHGTNTKIRAAARDKTMEVVGVSDEIVMAVYATEPPSHVATGAALDEAAIDAKGLANRWTATLEALKKGAAQTAQVETSEATRTATDRKTIREVGAGGYDAVDSGIDDPQGARDVVGMATVEATEEAARRANTAQLIAEETMRAAARAATNLPTKLALSSATQGATEDKSLDLTAEATEQEVINMLLDPATGGEVGNEISRATTLAITQSTYDASIDAQAEHATGVPTRITVSTAIRPTLDAAIHHAVAPGVYPLVETIIGDFTEAPAIVTFAQHVAESEAVRQAAKVTMAGDEAVVQAVEAALLAGRTESALNTAKKGIISTSTPGLHGVIQGANDVVGLATLQVTDRSTRGAADAAARQVRELRDQATEVTYEAGQATRTTQITSTGGAFSGLSQTDVTDAMIGTSTVVQRAVQRATEVSTTAGAFAATRQVARDAAARAAISETNLHINNTSYNEMHDGLRTFTEPSQRTEIFAMLSNGQSRLADPRVFHGGVCAVVSAAEPAASPAPKNTNWFSFDLQGAVDVAVEFGGPNYRYLLACAETAPSMWQGGNQWSAWDSVLSFFRHIVKLPIDYTKYDAWETLARHSGPRIVHPEFCMISDRPELLLVDEENRPHCDTGPFCRWRDGTALYAVHGVYVPEWIIEQRDTITVADIENEPNLEVKRVMTDLYGLARYLVDAGAEKIHQDGHGILWRRQVAGDPEPIVMVQVLNPTPEPDGTLTRDEALALFAPLHRSMAYVQEHPATARYKTYFLPVHHECRPLLEDPEADGGFSLGEPQPMTAHAAVASTWGMTAAEYDPEYAT